MDNDEAMENDAVTTIPDPLDGQQPLDNSEYNLATIFECAADQFAEREYIVANGKRCTYAQMDQRANRLAHHLAAQGIGRGDHVGIYAYNCIEWVESLWAIFKLRAVWININYRYVEDELTYIFDNADLKALIYQREFSQRVANVRGAMPLMRHLVMLQDGSDAPTCDLDAVDYEQALAQQSPARDFGPRSGDDIYMLFTGGTTGMPKAVMWRHQDVFYALGGGINQSTGEIVKHPQEVLDRGNAFAMCMLPAPPLMHGATQWAVMGGAFEGRKLVLVSHFDAAEVWQLVAQEKINGLFITGDAMGRPLIETWDQLDTRPDASSFFLLVSSAVVFSQTSKDQFLEYFPNLMMMDSMGSSETGGTGMLVVEKGKTEMRGGPTIKPGPGSVVLDPETLEPLPPGSTTIGVLATTGYIPLGYYKDEAKTAKTFVTAPDGTRYAMPGDHAMVEADGTVTVLGRGSVCINSGGEKIFPEEVESAVKSHPDVFDVTVVGVPDERWGSTVAAVVEPRPGKEPDLDTIQAHCRAHIAGYKVPRLLRLVAKIQRSPSGKPDYRWAKDMAMAVTPDVLS
jgi:acyl-CoA synthetase (AMP-forming)/AMP-acid ligase II